MCLLPSDEVGGSWKKQIVPSGWKTDSHAHCLFREWFDSICLIFKHCKLNVLWFGLPLRICPIDVVGQVCKDHIFTEALIIIAKIGEEQVASVSWGPGHFVIVHQSSIVELKLSETGHRIHVSISVCVLGKGLLEFSGNSLQEDSVVGKVNLL